MPKSRLARSTATLQSRRIGPSEVGLFTNLNSSATTRINEWLLELSRKYGSNPSMASRNDIEEEVSELAKRLDSIAHLGDGPLLPSMSVSSAIIDTVSLLRRVDTLGSNSNKLYLASGKAEGAGNEKPLQTLALAISGKIQTIKQKIEEDKLTSMGVEPDDNQENVTPDDISFWHTAFHSKVSGIIGSLESIIDQSPENSSSKTNIYKDLSDASVSIGNVLNTANNTAGLLGDMLDFRKSPSVSAFLRLTREFQSITGSETEVGQSIREWRYLLDGMVNTMGIAGKSMFPENHGANSADRLDIRLLLLQAKTEALQKTGGKYLDNSKLKAIIGEIEEIKRRTTGRHQRIMGFIGDITSLETRLSDLFENYCELKSANIFGHKPGNAPTDLYTAIKRAELFSINAVAIGKLGERFGTIDDSLQSLLGKMSANELKAVSKLSRAGRNAIMDATMLCSSLTDMHVGIARIGNAKSLVQAATDALDRIAFPEDSAGITPNSSGNIKRPLNSLKQANILCSAGVAPFSPFDITPNVGASIRIESISALANKNGSASLGLLGQSSSSYPTDVAKSLVRQIADSELAKSTVPNGNKEATPKCFKGAIELSGGLRELSYQTSGLKASLAKIATNGGGKNKNVPFRQGGAKVVLNNEARSANEAYLSTLHSLPAASEIDNYPATSFPVLKELIGSSWNNTLALEVLSADASAIANNEELANLNRSLDDGEAKIKSLEKQSHAFQFNIDGIRPNEEWVNLVSSSFNISVEDATSIQKLIKKAVFGVLPAGRSNDRALYGGQTLEEILKERNKAGELDISLLAHHGVNINLGTSPALANIVREEINYLSECKLIGDHFPAGAQVLTLDERTRSVLSKSLLGIANAYLQNQEEQEIRFTGEEISSSISSVDMEGKKPWQFDAIRDAKMGTRSLESLDFLKDKEAVSIMVKGISKSVSELNDYEIGKLIEMSDSKEIPPLLKGVIDEEYKRLPKSLQDAIKRQSFKYAALPLATDIFSRIVTGSLGCAGFATVAYVVPKVVDELTAPLNNLVEMANVLDSASGVSGIIGADPVLSHAQQLINGGQIQDATTYLASYLNSFNNFSPSAVATIIRPVWIAASAHDQMVAHGGAIDTIVSILQNASSSISGILIAAAAANPAAIPFQIIRMVLAEKARRSMLDTLAALESKAINIGKTVDDLNKRVSLLARQISAGGNLSDIRGDMPFMIISDSKGPVKDFTESLRLLEIKGGSRISEDGNDWPGSTDNMLRNATTEQVANFFLKSAIQNMESLSKQFVEGRNISIPGLLLLNTGTTGNQSALMDVRRVFLNNPQPIIVKSPFDHRGNAARFVKNKEVLPSSRGSIRSLFAKSIKNIGKSEEKIKSLRREKMEKETASNTKLLGEFGSKESIVALQGYGNSLQSFLSEFRRYDRANTAMMSISLCMNRLSFYQQYLTLLERSEDRISASDLQSISVELGNSKLATLVGSLDVRKFSDLSGAIGEFKSAIIATKQEMAENIEYIAGYTGLGASLAKTHPEISTPVELSLGGLSNLGFAMSAKYKSVSEKASSLLKSIDALANMGFSVDVERMVPILDSAIQRADIAEVIKKDAKDSSYFGIPDFNLMPSAVIAKPMAGPSDILQANFIVQPGSNSSDNLTAEPYIRVSVSRKSIKVSASNIAKAKKKNNKRLYSFGMAFKHGSNPALSRKLNLKSIPEGRSLNQPNPQDQSETSSVLSSSSDLDERIKDFEKPKASKRGIHHNLRNMARTNRVAPAAYIPTEPVHSNATRSPLSLGEASVVLKYAKGSNRLPKIINPSSETSGLSRQAQDRSSRSASGNKSGFVIVDGQFVSRKKLGEPRGSGTHLR